ncbi:hypothetical protein K474DRAFT_1707867 [Panus rudis PR-1116 ss-1]|nr:hypothetical protein K474DRAFT_1707867 [Panus rudis PR-1116 ss-1]
MPLITRVNAAETEEYASLLSTKPTFRVLRGSPLLDGDEMDLYRASYERYDLTPTQIQTVPRRRDYHHSDDIDSAADNDTTNWHTSMHDRISDEASEWYEAAVPNVSDVQSVLRQVVSHSGLTQRKVYAYLYPLFLYIIIFILAAILLPPGSCAHHILVDPLNHEADLAVGFTMLLGAVVGGLIVLRLGIWGVAVCVRWAIKLEVERKQRRSRAPLAEAGSLLGGLLSS